MSLTQLAAALSRALKDQDWMERARCRGVPTNTFFAEPASDGQVTGTVMTAKLYCAMCPVRAECLEWGFSNPHSLESGIYGGTTGEERKTIPKAALLANHARQVRHMMPAEALDPGIGQGRPGAA